MTGYDIDSLSFQQTFIGNLSKDSTTDFINYASISSVGFPRGIIKGISLFDANTYPICGTGIKHYTDGVYFYDIKLGDVGRGLSLLITTHK